MSPKYRKVWLVVGGTVAGMTLVFHVAYPSAGRGRTVKRDTGIAWQTATFADESIASRVRIALGWHYSSSVIPTVTARGSVVTLTGVAASIAQRDFMTDCAKDVEGVTAIRNRMTIAGSELLIE